MKVIIIGKGVGWEKAPKDGETWGINDVIQRRPVKLIIDMHDWGNNYRSDRQKTLQLAIETKTPLISVNAYPEHSLSMAYPLRDIIDFFGTDYLGSTLDYAIAYAIYKGARELDLYGINLESGTEYTMQKPSAEFWLGVAKGRGIKVKIHGESRLLKTGNKKLYGYQTEQKEQLCRKKKK